MLLSMSRMVNIAEAKAQLSELIASAVAGDEVTIAKAGKPLVRLVQVEQARQGKRTLGIWPRVPTPDAVLIGPMDPENQAALEGCLSDDDGISIKQS